MADAVGVAHVGIGSDMMGLVAASALPNYERWAELAALLLRRFTPQGASGILGGKYVRVAWEYLAKVPS